MISVTRLRDDFSSLQQLIGASSILLAGRVAGAGANFLFAVMLARLLSPAEAGAAFASISTAFLASIALTFNIESGSIRFLVAARQSGDEETLAGFIAFGRRLLFCTSPIICGVYILVAAAGADGKHIAAIACAAASIPAIGWLRLSGSHATALGKPAHGSLPRTALQPSLLLTLFIAAMGVGAPATAETALACFFASFMLTALFQFALLRRHLQPRRNVHPHFTPWRDWLANGFYLSPNILLQDYLQHSIVLAAALTMSAQDIAVLAISLRCVSLLRFGVLSINMAVIPKISRAIASSNDAERDQYFRNAALLKAPIALFAVAGVGALSSPILSFFGPEYAGNGQVLTWLTLIPAVTALAGPNHLLLNISGKRRSIFAVSITAIAVLFTTTPAAAAIFGLVGAAAAASAIYVCWEAALFLAVRMNLNMDPSILAVFKQQ